MRYPLIGSMALFIGGTAAQAQESFELPAVEITVPRPSEVIQASYVPSAAETPRKLPPVNEIEPPKLDAPQREKVKLFEVPKPEAPLPAGIVPKSTGCSPPAPCCYLPEACTVCRTMPRSWLNLEYLLWTEKDEPLNAVLFTQGSLASGGRLNAPGVGRLFGGDPLDFGSFNGGRIEGGYWLNSAGTIGIEAAGFLLERGGIGFHAASGANDPLILARPFVTPIGNTPIENSRVVTVPPAVLGGVFAFASSHLWGADTDIILNLRERSCYRVDALVGFRYIDLRETLIAGDNTNSSGPFGFQQNTIDSFATRNQFYGTELGFRATAKRGRIDMSATVKVGLGVTHEVLDIVGQTDFIGPFLNFQTGNGFLAAPSNSGQLIRDRFAVAPETILKVSYRLTEHLNAYVAYDFLYLSNVMRPGDQVDRVVTPLLAAQLPGFGPAPGPVRPAATGVPGDLFAQGISLGLGVTY